MATKVEFSDKAKAEMGSTTANEIAGGFNKVLAALESVNARIGSLETQFKSLDSLVDRIESRLWPVMTPVVIGALGMILGAGAMIYAAIQLMS